MNKKILLILCLTPIVIIGVLFLVFFILSIQIDYWMFLFITTILAPYCFAFYQEYKADSDVQKLTEHELNLIQEKENIVKTFEIISIILSFLFGLFMTFNFDLLVNQHPFAEPISYIANSFAFNFFMSTFAFMQTQVLGKDLFLTEEEVENISITSPMTNKIMKFIKRFKFANFVRMAIYYSLLVQISVLYPIIMIVIGL